MAELAPNDEIGGYRARFVYRIFGHSLRGTLYPVRTVFIKKRGILLKTRVTGIKWWLGGRLLLLKGRIYHDDRKPLKRWIASQQHML